MDEGPDVRRRQDRARHVLTQAAPAHWCRRLPQRPARRRELHDDAADEGHFGDAVGGFPRLDDRVEVALLARSAARRGAEQVVHVRRCPCRASAPSRPLSTSRGRAGGAMSGRVAARRLPAVPAPRRECRRRCRRSRGSCASDSISSSGVGAHFSSRLSAYQMLKREPPSRRLVGDLALLDRGQGLAPRACWRAPRARAPPAGTPSSRSMRRRRSASVVFFRSFSRSVSRLDLPT